MSEPFSPRDVATWCRGELLRGETGARFDGVSIDTRTIRPGQLFVAICGPNFDAHDFLDRALDDGARGLLIDRQKFDKLIGHGDQPVIGVDDTTRALGELAAAHRQRFSGPVVALTGSSGKTTSKEMCAAVLGAKWDCLKTEGNLNNEFGLPLTLMRRESHHEAAIVELGMNHRGEIARLAQIAAPTVAVITNIGTAHIEYLGSLEAIAEEKGDLFAALGEHGIAVANWDDPNVALQSKRCSGEVVRYGVSPDAQVRAEAIRFLPEGAFVFDLITPQGRVQARVEGLGETTIINALAAAGAGVACGLDPAQIARGLGAYAPIAGRMTRLALARSITLIDDSYNANPQSMTAALETLARLKGPGRGIAILGAMGELGEESEAAHQGIGSRVAELGIDGVVVLGDVARDITSGAAAGGMDADRITFFESFDDAKGPLAEMLEPRDIVLVKGSRAARMERVVELLANEDAE